MKPVNSQTVITNNTTIPKKATDRYISMFNEYGEIDHATEYSENGFDVEGDSSSRIYYEGDKIPELVKDLE